MNIRVRNDAQSLVESAWSELETTHSYVDTSNRLNVTSSRISVVCGVVQWLKETCLVGIRHGSLAARIWGASCVAVNVEVSYRADTSASGPAIGVSQRINQLTMTLARPLAVAITRRVHTSVLHHAMAKKRARRALRNARSPANTVSVQRHAANHVHHVQRSVVGAVPTVIAAVCHVQYRAILLPVLSDVEKG